MKQLRETKNNEADNEDAAQYLRWGPTAGRLKVQDEAVLSTNQRTCMQTETPHLHTTGSKAVLASPT